MAEHFQPTFLIIIIVFVPSIHCFIVTSDNIPNFIDRFVQFVWEPSSLVRLWVGLDQLYNVASSWRGVAKKLVSLPLGEDGSMAHVRLQEPRHLKYHKPSAAAHYDRFNKIYASSDLSPIVARARAPQVYYQQTGNVITDLQPIMNQVQNVLKTESNPVPIGLPPLLLFQPQEVLLNFIPKDLLQNVNHLGYSSPFANRDDLTAISKIMDLQKLEHHSALRNLRYANQFGGNFKPFVSTKKVYQAAVLNPHQQERLNMFLGLMKNLGDMHTNSVASKSVSETKDKYS